MADIASEYTDESKEAAFTEKESDSEDKDAVVPFTQSEGEASNWSPREVTPREKAAEDEM